ncbi:acyl carrier protein [Plantactinospora soyae]|uniref:Aryl carrier-like protein n=1 Tax=Plantactinospora soyae TaxID=1544732 RepID=A0A927QYG6_9ACTN|nr:acyl carrier protein [Plantactinospora soyae]MBE1489195.1 aryl carrier-like protein [Plantactinospora soyae]
MSVPQNGAHGDVLESVLVHCWESALRQQPIGPHDNFFAIGGHSLVAMRIAHRLRKTFGVPVDYVLLLEHPTIAALAQKLRDSGFVTPELDRAGREYLVTHRLPVPDPR